MPVLICLREKLWTRTCYIGDQVPTCSVFTRAKIKVPFWDFSQFRVTDCLARSSYLYFFLISFNFTLGSDSKVHNLASFLFLCWLLLGQVVWSRLGDPFVCQNPRGVCVSHFPGQMLGCACTISLYGEISISCTIPSGSPCPSSCV